MVLIFIYQKFTLNFFFCLPFPNCPVSSTTIYRNEIIYMSLPHCWFLSHKVFLISASYISFIYLKEDHRKSLFYISNQKSLIMWISLVKKCQSCQHFLCDVWFQFYSCQCHRHCLQENQTVPPPIYAIDVQITAIQGFPIWRCWNTH